MSFLTIVLATALGTFCGNLSLAFVIGLLTKIQQDKKQKQIRDAVEGQVKAYNELVAKERERMQKYAKLEG